MLLIAASLAACSFPTRPNTTIGLDRQAAETALALTLESLATATRTATIPAPPAVATPSLIFTPTLWMASTATGTITPTFSAPLLSFQGNTNCREGPGTIFKVVTMIREKQKVEPVGLQGNYWIVKNPNGEGTCWVAGDYVTPSGSTWILPTMTTPAPPTSVPPIAPSLTKWDYTCAPVTGGNTLTMVLTWKALATNFDGYRLYRDDQVIQTLTSDVTTYTDVTFLESGKTVEYHLEVYTGTSSASTSVIQATCQ